jgi:hypothetical protein
VAGLATLRLSPPAIAILKTLAFHGSIGSQRPARESDKLRDEPDSFFETSRERKAHSETRIAVDPVSFSARHHRR